jgi:bacterial leucyl aminopeptidase
MSVFTGVRGTAVALLALALAVPAGAAQDEAWITIERTTAQRALAGFGAAGKPGALTIVDSGRPESLATGAKDTDVVVARIAESDVAELSAIIHRELRRCGGFVWHATREEAEQTAARANGPQPEPAAGPREGYSIDKPGIVQTLLADMAEVNVRNTITALGAHFTRYHACASGTQSATWIRDRWQLYAQNRPDVTVEFFVHPAATTPQPSVILTIPGSRNASEVVVLGAHQDSVAGSNCSTSRSPGEDDDASGIASLTEVIRVALARGYRPAKTVKFMAYAAEEVGLRGSRNIAQTYRSQNVNVVGVLQLDMTNFQGSLQDIFIYTDHTNATQNTFVSSLVDTYLPGLTRSTSACGYACSDHASWTEQNYPASFPFEARFGQHNSSIHSANDTISQSGGVATHALKFSKLAAAYMVEVAKGKLPGGPSLPPAPALRSRAKN